MIRIAVCAPHEVDSVWHLVVHGLQRAYEYSNDETSYTTGQLWQLCRSGRAFLVLAWDEETIRMASVWRFEDKDGKPIFRCLMMYGAGMAEWVDLAHDWINKLARDNGAQWLVSAGRRGWLRVFKAAQWGDDMAIEVTE